MVDVGSCIGGLLMSRKLLIIQPDQFMEVQFDQQITIGRDMYNSLCLQDPEISRSHAIIFEQNGEIILKDLKSRNGCYVRGRKTNEAVVHSGDEMIMGGTVILFDPPDTLEIPAALSQRGKYLIEKRTGRDVGAEAPRHHQVFTCSEMDREIASLLATPEATTYFSLPTAVMLLKAVKQMDQAVKTPELFECTLRRALGIIGGHRGVIMETDASKEKVKVRSIISDENADSIVIVQQVLKTVLTQEKCVFCTDVARDRHFQSVADNSDRPVHSFVAVPVVGHEELFGFIYLDSSDDSVAYNRSDLRSLYFLAGHLGALLRSRPMHFSKHAPTSFSQA